MIIELREANDKKNQFVEAEIGDRVRVEVYDSITAEGTLHFVNTESGIIELTNYTILDVCHPGTSVVDNGKTELTLKLDTLYSLEVATYDSFTPEAMLNEALSQNYRGSKQIIMSPLFHSWYAHYMRDERYNNQYNGIPIIVDSEQAGMLVHAVPNDETVEYNLEHDIDVKSYQTSFPMMDPDGVF